MYKLDIINLESNKRFIKNFDSVYLMNKFLNKCKYSKRIKVVSIIKEVF
jgi:hypothetical protein